MASRLAFLISLFGSLLLVGQPLAADSPPRPAWLGVVVVEVPFDWLAAQRLEYGVEVSQVVPRSPAATAGLRPGDLILSIADKPVYSVQRLHWLVNTLSSGQTVPVEYFRAGQKQTLTIELASPPPRGEPSSRGAHHRHPPLRSYLGIGLQAMTDDLRQAFGAPRDSGVLVTEVVDASPAAQAGVMAGDVIIRMDRKRIAEVGDVYRVLDFFEAGDEITIELIRAKASKLLTVVLAAAPDSGVAKPWYPPWDSPPAIPAPFLEPHYWERQLDQLLERWREYWREEPEAYPYERRL